MIRSSLQMSPTVREVRLECSDLDCGHSFLAQISVIRTIRPSRLREPEVELPAGDRKLGWDGKATPPDTPPANDGDPYPLLDGLMTTSG